MALKKLITYSTGYQANYHRIANIQSDFNAGVTHVMVSSYADVDTRATEQETWAKEMGKNVPVTPSTAYEATFYELPYLEAPTREQIYAELLKLPVFSDAEVI